jgi:hypothetical protein
MEVGGQRHVTATLPSGKGPGTHSIGVWVGPRAGLDVCGKPSSHRNSIPGSSSLRKALINQNLIIE